MRLQFSVLPNLWLGGEYQVAFHHFSWDIESASYSSTEFSSLVQGSSLEWHCLLRGCSSRGLMGTSTVNCPRQRRTDARVWLLVWLAIGMPHRMNPPGKGQSVDYVTHGDAMPRDWSVNVTCWSRDTPRGHPSRLRKYICMCMWAEWGQEYRNTAGPQTPSPWCLRSQWKALGHQGLC